jgi:lysophospholipase L1-like esterase
LIKEIIIDGFPRVFGTTILPAAYMPAQVAEWQKVNTWMREEWSRWFDGMFDFAAALEHPEGGGKLNLSYNSGDGTHPNDLGYQRIADAVDIEQVAGKHSH